MSTPTNTKQHLRARRATTEPSRAFERQHADGAASDRDASVAAFVARTTAASGVPFLVEDDSVIAQIARVLT
jgi:hypothetical protein